MGKVPLACSGIYTACAAGRSAKSLRASSWRILLQGGKTWARFITSLNVPKCSSTLQTLPCASPSWCGRLQGLPVPSHPLACFANIFCNRFENTFDKEISENSEKTYGKRGLRGRTGPALSCFWLFLPFFALSGANPSSVKDGSTNVCMPREASQHPGPCPA